MKLSEIASAQTALADADLLYGVADGTSYSYLWSDVKKAIQSQVVPNAVVMTVTEDLDGVNRAVFNIM